MQPLFLTLGESWATGGKVAGQTPACGRWQSVCTPEAQPAALFAAPQGETVELLDHPGVFPLDPFLAALYSVQAQGPPGASFVCSNELL